MCPKIIALFKKKKKIFKLHFCNVNEKGKVKLEEEKKCLKGFHAK